jgi:16S rRNA (cytidine1402-2'-O)-methyltransferase
MSAANRPSGGEREARRAANRPSGGEREARSAANRPPGRLVLVATPLGNVADLQPRALSVLTSADAVACEDTRETRKLLQLAGVSAGRLIAVHEHNEAAMVDPILARLGRGETVALVSDAGMPGISDPGERLVAAVVGAGFDVSVVPGPSAAVAALVISGLPTGRWVFEGFMPRKGGDRATRLSAVAVEARTVVLYEAPHRLRATLADLARVCGGDRRVVLVRELTKLHEEVWRGTLASAVASDASPRGEYVVVLEGAPVPGAATDDTIDAALADELASGSDRRTAVAQVAAALGVPKRRVYEAAVRARP